MTVSNEQSQTLVKVVRTVFNQQDAFAIGEDSSMNLTLVHTTVTELLGIVMGGGSEESKEWKISMGWSVWMHISPAVAGG